MWGGETFPLPSAAAAWRYGPPPLPCTSSSSSFSSRRSICICFDPTPPFPPFSSFIVSLCFYPWRSFVKVLARKANMFVTRLQPPLRPLYYSISILMKGTQGRFFSLSLSLTHTNGTHSTLKQHNIFLKELRFFPQKAEGFLPPPTAK